MSDASIKWRSRAQAPAPGSRQFYLRQAETCMAQAAHAADAGAQELFTEECRLWLLLAHNREAIETVLQDYLDAPTGR